MQMIKGNRTQHQIYSLFDFMTSLLTSLVHKEKLSLIKTTKMYLHVLQLYLGFTSVLL